MHFCLKFAAFLPQIFDTCLSLFNNCLFIYILIGKLLNLPLQLNYIILRLVKLILQKIHFETLRLTVLVYLVNLDLLQFALQL